MSVQFYVHSDYSLLQSTLTIERLVKRAEQLGIEMLALTDYNTTAGHYEFQERCKRAGIKPILGLEVSVQYQDAKEAPVVLIAVTQLGYENLLRLASLPVPISYANLVEFKGGLALLEGVGT
ncbi:MAG: PHP domain-containing protein, partial [Limnochordia bacterium]